MKSIIGISACLLGEKVRYNGEDRLDHYLKYTVSRYVKWLPVCPEVEAGLPVPREPMVLFGKGGLVRLITVNTGIDLTEKLNKWIKKKLKELHKLNLSGFVFKSRSPSCGLSVKIVETNQKTSGLFAHAFKKSFPEIPVTENETLYDPEERRNFFERVLMYNAFKKVKTENQLKDFHLNYRLLFLTRGIEACKCLDGIINSSIKDKRALYLKAMNNILSLKAKPENEERVFRLLINELKSHIDSKTEKALLKMVKDFKREKLSRTYILYVLRHYAELYGIKKLLSEPYLFMSFLN
mgnify:CR=1 FL=1